MFSNHQRAIARFKKRVRQAHAEIFEISPNQFPEHDRLWSEWLALKEGPENLFGTFARDVYLARALALMFSPTLGSTPFENTADDRHLLSDARDWHTLRDFYLSSELLDFALVLVTLSKELGTKLGEEGKASLACNKFILAVLEFMGSPVRPSGSFRKEFDWFPLYELNDFHVFYNMDDCSGYGPFSDLLVSDASESIKAKADGKMRDIIESEQSGKTSPRAEHEDALSRYEEIIATLLFTEERSYSLHLLRNQLNYLFENHRSQNSFFLRPEYFFRLYKRFMEDDSVSLTNDRRFLETKRKILDAFLEHNGDLLSAELRNFGVLEQILKDFPDLDGAARETVGSLILQAKGTTREEEETKARRDKQRKAVYEKLAA